MKTYKIVFGGRGAEIYLHYLTENKKNLLSEMFVQKKDDQVDFDKLNEILEVENWDYAEQSFSGTYPSPESYHISVFDDKDNLVWESDDNFFMDQGNEDDDYQLLEEQNLLLIENYIKGTIKEYILKLEEDFNPENLTYQSVDINEEIQIITDLKYNNQVMELDDWGDSWSKGVYFYVF